MGRNERIIDLRDLDRMVDEVPVRELAVIHGAVVYTLTLLMARGL